MHIYCNRRLVLVHVWINKRLLLTQIAVESLHCDTISGLSILHVVDVPVTGRKLPKSTILDAEKWRQKVESFLRATLASELML